MALNQMSTLTFGGQRIKSRELQGFFLKLPGDSLYHVQEKLMILPVCLHTMGCKGLNLAGSRGSFRMSLNLGQQHPSPKDPTWLPPWVVRSLSLLQKGGRSLQLLCFSSWSHSAAFAGQCFISLVTFCNKKQQCLEGTLRSRLMVLENMQEKGLTWKQGGGSSVQALNRQNPWQTKGLKAQSLL